MALDVAKRFLGPGQIGTFPVKVGDVVKDVYFRVQRRKFSCATNFSMGSITAASDTGSGWKEIKDGDIYVLSPNMERLIYHGFIGINPSDAWLYEQYPSGTYTRKVRGLASIGEEYGYVTGWQSPYLDPSELTEFMTIYDLAPPVYNMYSPHNDITGYLNFYFMKYWSKFIDDPAVVDASEKRTMEAVPVVLGDVEDPLTAPNWLSEFLARRDQKRGKGGV